MSEGVGDAEGDAEVVPVGSVDEGDAVEVGDGTVVIDGIVVIDGGSEVGSSTTGSVGDAEDPDGAAELADGVVATTVGCATTVSVGGAAKVGEPDTPATARARPSATSALVWWVAVIVLLPLVTASVEDETGAVGEVLVHAGAVHYLKPVSQL